MTRKIFATTLIVAVAALCASLAIADGHEGMAEGRYAIHYTQVDQTELPGGGAVQVAHYKQFTQANDPGHPLDDTTGDCVAVTYVNSEGAQTSASGSCFVTDGEGNTASFWWRQDDAGSDSCPTQCGSWGYFAGAGKLAGIGGEGTWVGTTVFPDGSLSGTWKGKYSLP